MSDPAFEASLLIVSDPAGSIVMLLQLAEVPGAISVVLPAGMITSVPAVGMLPPAQFPAVAQSLLAVPVKVPLVSVVKVTSSP